MTSYIKPKRTELSRFFWKAWSDGTQWISGGKEFEGQGAITEKILFPVATNHASEIGGAWRSPSSVNQSGLTDIVGLEIFQITWPQTI